MGVEWTTIGDCRLAQGDCLAVLPTLDDAYFDAVVTDAPYSSGGQFRGDRMVATNIKYTPHTDRVYSPFAGDTRDQRSFGYWCALWLGECLRVTKTGGVCLLFTDWRQLPTTTDALQSGGWVWRGIVPWNKTEAARPAKGRFRNQCEYVVWGSNGSMGSEVAVDNIRECLPGFFTQPVAGTEKLHVAGKPTKVMRGLLEIVPAGGRVLDPFAGSGTTLIAAMQTGREAFGIEIDKDHLTIAANRLRACHGKGSLFEHAEDARA